MKYFILKMWGTSFIHQKIPISFCGMLITAKINFTELNVPKDNFTEYPYGRKPIFRIHIAESILPKLCKIWKVFTKKFCMWGNWKNYKKKFQSDPEEPLNNYLL